MPTVAVAAYSDELATSIRPIVLHMGDSGRIPGIPIPQSQRSRPIILESSDCVGMSLWPERRPNPLGEGAIDPRNLGQFLHSRRTDSRQAAEVA